MSTVGDQAEVRLADAPRPRHLLAEFGFTFHPADGELHGSGAITPAMHAPGTGRVRPSVLASWADMIGGMLTIGLITPRVPVTLDLDLHLYRPAPGSGRARAVGRAVKRGRSVTVIEVEFLDDGGAGFGFSGMTFMAAPGVSRPFSPRGAIFDQPEREPTLALPLADRAGCQRERPGTAVLPRTEDGLNGAGTMHGGLLALAVEEAVLSLAPGETLSSLALRYLAPVRVGPAVARATLEGGLGRVEVRDSGREDRLAVTASARLTSR